MNKEINIAGNAIGHESPCFIIAEAGVNHNGNVEMAKRLVLEAKKCGADCVKFQTFKAERVVTESAPKAAYQLLTTNPAESQLSMLKNLELDLSAYHELIMLCREHQIVFMSTPYSTEDVDFLDGLGVPAFKLSSISVAEPMFIQYVAKKGKPIILSTGMATLGEIDLAVRTVKNAGNDQLILLQCTTNYPSRNEDANLLAMKTIQGAFGGVVGYSDHTQDEVACIASIALGAKVIEKHFTLDKSLPGPDQSSSADPAEFSELVHKIRMTEMVLGSPRKEPCDIERTNSIGMRRSVVVKSGIKQGQVITPDMLTLKRPATGIAPALVDQILGRTVLRDLAEDHILTWSDIG